MPNAPVSQIWPNGQLNHPGTQPGNSVGHFRRRFRERSILGRITNRNYDASQFKGKGSVLTIPDTPVVTTRKTRMGEPVEYEEIKTGAHFMVIDRERYWGIKIEDEDKLFANFDIESPIVQEADLQLAEDVEDAADARARSQPTTSPTSETSSAKCPAASVPERSSSAPVRSPACSRRAR